jgi:hypothetical protein
VTGLRRGERARRGGGDLGDGDVEGAQLAIDGRGARALPRDRGVEAVVLNDDSDREHDGEDQQQIETAVPHRLLHRARLL